jgi:hypothetical protein
MLRKQKQMDEISGWLTLARLLERKVSRGFIFYFLFFYTAYTYTNILYIFVWTKIASGMTRWAKLTTGSMAALFLEYILLKIILKFLLKSNYVE